MAWCMRFKENARNPLKRTTGNLTVPELSAALICLVRSVQFVYFSKDIQCIMKGEILSNSSVEATLANLRTQFWVTNGRSTVKRVWNNCLKCLK
ncbi:integrase catalytic domain-containing protein, partial [Nephila pilipes]